MVSPARLDNFCRLVGQMWTRRDVRPHFDDGNVGVDQNGRYELCLMMGQLSTR